MCLDSCSFSFSVLRGNTGYKKREKMFTGLRVVTEWTGNVVLAMVHKLCALKICEIKCILYILYVFIVQFS